MADIAHELRTPLAVLQGELEGMLDGIYPRDEAQINAVLQETRMLARLVERSSNARAYREWHARTAEGVDGYRSAGERHHRIVRGGSGRAQGHLEVHAAPDLPLIEVDPLRIREVLTNLISNALHHTPGGGRVSVDAAARMDAIVVTVSDTGSGIAETISSKSSIVSTRDTGRAARGWG